MIVHFNRDDVFLSTEHIIHPDSYLIGVNKFISYECIDFVSKPNERPWMLRLRMLLI